MSEDVHIATVGEPMPIVTQGAPALTIEGRMLDGDKVIERQAVEQVDATNWTWTPPKPGLWWLVFSTPTGEVSRKVMVFDAAMVAKQPGDRFRVWKP